MVDMIIQIRVEIVKMSMKVCDVDGKGKKKCAKFSQAPTKKEKDYRADPINCLICDKAFLHKGSYKMHSRTKMI